MAKKTEIWVIFWSVEIENIDHSILASGYSVAFETSMIERDKRFHTDITYLSVNLDQEG